MQTLSWFWGSLKRCKTLAEDNSKTQLARCLTLLDLTGLGVGSTLGLGVYVLAGSVAKTVAGPAVCISFLVAAIASAFAGVCYAEFAVRVPKAGSAYVYSYVSVGEFIAFTIGWNLILEYVIGTAGVAKGMSNYIDALSGNVIKNSLTSVMPINLEHLADYPDFLAFGLVAAITFLLAIGAKISTGTNNIFTILNLLTIAIVVVAGSIKANPFNWQIPIEEIPAEHQKDAGVGGFAPFGIAGIMAGAAKCFFGFVGFDCVATTGEEAINPQRNIPLSITLSLIIVFVSYFSVATVLTMMLPYYLQDADAPFPFAFDVLEMSVVKWIVTIGALFALCASLLGALFPLPRVLYAMGNDGVLYRWLAKVNKKTMTPILATTFSGLFAGVMAAIFNLNQLIDMMSIGTLMAYTIVAISVLVLRFEENMKQRESMNNSNYSVTAKEVFMQLFNVEGLKYPSALSYNIVKVVIVLFSVLSLGLCMILNWDSMENSTTLPLIVTLTVLLIISWFIIQRQPQDDTSKLVFKVPLVPFIPCISIFINLYLMTQLDLPTWIRFIVWLAIGYAIYFSYGIRHSSENLPTSESNETIPSSKPSDSDGVFGFENTAYVTDDKNVKQITQF